MLRSAERRARDTWAGPSRPAEAVAPSDPREEDDPMALRFRPLHPHFVAEVSPVDLREVHDAATLAEIRGGMDRYAILVFRAQPFTNGEQLAFAQRPDGQLHAKTGTAALGLNRFGNNALVHISNLDERGEITAADNRRRVYSLGNRLWHTDASFQDPAGRYSMLSAKVLPPAGADTEYADLRAAYDALPETTKAQITDLKAHHSIAYSRQVLGFEFSAQEQDALKGAIHPIVRTLPRTNRKSLYVASHASRIIDWPLPEGRLLLRDLIEHATQRQFVYRHAWHVGDLVIWDNRCTMHRATPFEDTR